jgi:DNA processing protein
MKNLKYWVWLSSIDGIGPKKFTQLVECFGSPLHVWNASDQDLRRIGLADKQVQAILSDNARQNIDHIMNKINQLGIKVITTLDSQYPIALKSIDDPPPVLYVRGSFEKADDRAVAVVGSRNITQYGIRMAKEISFELARRGITVVSGMARGVDTCAHRGVLEAEGRTIAVLGCGVDIAYPPENKNLIEQVSKSGAVVSEYVVGKAPLAMNFPARNRIISGLSMGVIVIEAGEKSGALITVDFAIEQGREVFAIPGNAKSPVSIGTNRLIREGAKMVTCVDDVLEEFTFNLNRFKPAQKEGKENCSHNR